MPAADSTNAITTDSIEPASPVPEMAPPADTSISALDTGIAPAAEAPAVFESAPTRASSPTERIREKPEIIEEVQVEMSDDSLFASYPAAENILTGRNVIDSSVFVPKNKVFLEDTKVQQYIEKISPKLNPRHEASETNWILFVAGAAVMILLSLRLWYQKFLSSIMNTLVNFQLAEKLLREKNIIVRRAFWLLNINYILSFSFFIWVVTIKYELPGFYEKGYANYLAIVAILSLYTLIRLAYSQLIAVGFDSKPVFQEYNHHVFLINKNLGLLLLPIGLGIIFVNEQLSEILLYVGIGLVVLFLLMKFLRGLQIIIKHGALLFYAFLYLCTLEILPLLLGFKYYISLI